MNAHETADARNARIYLEGRRAFAAGLHLSRDNPYHYMSDRWYWCEGHRDAAQEAKA